MKHLTLITLLALTGCASSPPQPTVSASPSASLPIERANPQATVEAQAATRRQLERELAMLRAKMLAHKNKTRTKLFQPKKTPTSQP